MVQDVMEESRWKMRYKKETPSQKMGDDGRRDAALDQYNHCRHEEKHSRRSRMIRINRKASFVREVSLFFEY
jgi:hypothetical protein